jgi:S-adenosylmethionine:tRNA ribosyltransferase-isomerase
MLVTDFDFALPEGLIAQTAAPRGQSRLLALDRGTGLFEHRAIADLPAFFRPGDVLVVNDTRVFAARLLGHRVPSGGAVECLLLSPQPTGPHEPRTTLPNEPRITLANEPPITQTARSSGQSGIPAIGEDPDVLNASDPAVVPVLSAANETSVANRAVEAVEWDALMHPGQKLKPGAVVRFEGDAGVLMGKVLERRFQGRRTIRLWSESGASVMALVDAIGHVPLPPYIKRQDTAADSERYQTVYARVRGSVAAPTAGLHFTESLLEELRARGVERVSITLHVGYGTFKPVKVDRVEDHVVDPEIYAITDSAAEAIGRARAESRRVIAVGTTTTRALEDAARRGSGVVRPGPAAADIFIYPGFEFQVVNGMLTNFHLPKSSLLMLVSAFAGRERVLNAYAAAVAERYRFYSYGDAMVIT